MKKSKYWPVIFVRVAGSAARILTAAPENTIFPVSLYQQVITLFTKIGRLGNSALVGECHFAPFRITTAKPVVAFFLVRPDQASHTGRTSIMFIYFTGGFPGQVVERGSAVRETTAAPKWPHFSFQAAQGFLARRAWMYSFGNRCIFRICHLNCQGVTVT